MEHKIIVCGLNGAGKSTIVRAMGNRTGWATGDIEDYYFPKTDLAHPWAVRRTEEKIAVLLQHDLRAHDNFILAAVRGNYGEEVPKLFTAAVFISAPKEIRMQRVRQRAIDKFGDRVMKGGDMYESEQAFYQMIAKRSEKTVTDWLAGLQILVITIDGTRPVAESVEIICEAIGQQAGDWYCQNAQKTAPFQKKEQ